MNDGINTEVRHRGCVYHVQTQTGERIEPVVETLIFEAGQVVVRVTASLNSLSDKWRVPVDDVSRLLALQHWEMIHKIKKGMLDGDDPTPAADPPSGPVGAPGASPTSIVTDDPETLEVLAELESKLDRLVRGEGDPLSGPGGESE
jgi:hypothetical protein